MTKNHEGKGRKQDWEPQWYIFLLCHAVWGKHSFSLPTFAFLFVVKCWQSSLFNFFAIFKYHFKTTSLYWTSTLSFCPKFSNANLAYEDRYTIDLQMQVWHMKIDMQLIFRLDRARFLFQKLPDLFCLPITWHHLHPPNHPDRNYRSYFRLCFLLTHQHKTSGQILLQILS